MLCLSVRPHLPLSLLVPFYKLNINKGALSREFSCMLVKTYQIFNKEPLLKLEIALRGGKCEIISPRKN